MYYFDSKRGISYFTQWVKAMIFIKPISIGVSADIENEFHGFRSISRKTTAETNYIAFELPFSSLINSLLTGDVLNL